MNEIDCNYICDIEKLSRDVQSYREKHSLTYKQLAKKCGRKEANVFAKLCTNTPTSLNVHTFFNVVYSLGLDINSYVKKQ